jgi:hypothetical protein
MTVRSPGATSTHIKPSPKATTATNAATTKPVATTKPTQAAAYAQDGATTKDDAARLSQKPVKQTGLLAFLLANKTGALDVGPEVVARARHPSTQALLALRAGAIAEFAPLVEVVRQDGSTATGFLRGVDAEGRAIVDGGEGARVAIPPDEALRAVRPQMDTDGDLHPALVTVFDAATHVVDPFALGAYAGKTVVVERYDAEHATLAAAAKKGDVFDAKVVVKGASSEGLVVDGGTIARADWKIARVQVEIPAYSYKKDGQRLRDVARVLVPGVAVEVTRSGGRSLAGTFLGVAQDARGDDYLVVRARNGTTHAVKDDVLDVRSAATTIDLWRDPERARVYSS